MHKLKFEVLFEIQVNVGQRLVRSRVADRSSRTSPLAISPGSSAISILEPSTPALALQH